MMMTGLLHLHISHMFHLDIDECQEQRDATNCVFSAGNGYCTNTIGSFECGCSEGFKGDGLIDGIGCIGI